MSVPLVQTKHLKKFFNTPKGALHAVDDVNIDILKGHTLGVVGESGCGKSTLGRTILRLIEPTEGEVLYNGQDILSMGHHEMNLMRQKMQIIFQDPYASLNPRMTVSEIIAEPIKVCGLITNRRELEERTAQLMEVVGLDYRFVNTYPHELDGGRRQRIGIARALALDPEFIVCDEPVSALDVSIQAQVLNLLQDLQEKMELTFMFITHDLSVVNHFSDDIAVMYLGQLVEKAPAEELFAHPLHPYTKALFSAIPIPDPDDQSERIIIKGEITSPINLPDACHFAPRCQYCEENCHHGNPALVEVRPNHFVACSCVEEINAL